MKAFCKLMTALIFVLGVSSLAAALVHRVDESRSKYISLYGTPEQD